jgi:5-methyltetrahydrofolate--homocysteine methyltransferase
MTPSVRWLNEQDELPILAVPNADMPLNEGGTAIYKMTPTETTEMLKAIIFWC